MYLSFRGFKQSLIYDCWYNCWNTLKLGIFELVASDATLENQDLTG